MILGFLSDCHGCVEALDKALELLREAGAEQVFHLGDSVGYFPGWAAADRLRAEDVPCLLGNHEHMLLNETWERERDEIYGFGETLAQATPQRLAWLASLPASLRLAPGRTKALLVHGSPRDPVSEYVYPDSPLDGLDPGEASVVLMGHTHRPFIRERQGILFVNVGSCALPRDDSGLGSACLWNTEDGQPTLVRFPVGDEVRRAAERCLVHPKVLKRAETLTA